MKVLFHLGHPAHFHLFKNTIRSLQEKKYEIIVVIKKKDVLEELLINEGFTYTNILPYGRKGNLFSIAKAQMQQILTLRKIAKKQKPNLLIGSTPTIAIVGKLLRIKSIILAEDDAEAVPQFANMAYPFVSKIVTPNNCSVGKWKHKKIGHNSYHELAYLHPDNFSPSEEIASKYVDINSPFFVIRFSGLDAYHDKGISGISKSIFSQIMETLEKHGKVYITTERNIPLEYSKNILKIPPTEIHHVMAFSKIFIGDSQTMSAESAVLGVPFIRVNDFVGKLSYLNELENHYKLGFGIKPGNSEKIIPTLNQLLCSDDSEREYLKRRNKMLSEKINFEHFLTNLIEKNNTELGTHNTEND